MKNNLTLSRRLRTCWKFLDVRAASRATIINCSTCHISLCRGDKQSKYAALYYSPSMCDRSWWTRIVILAARDDLNEMNGNRITGMCKVNTPWCFYYYTRSIVNPCRPTNRSTDLNNRRNDFSVSDQAELAAVRWMRFRTTLMPQWRIRFGRSRVDWKVSWLHKFILLRLTLRGRELK